MVNLNTANALYLGSTKASAAYLGANRVWNGAVVLPAIGAPFMGGYYAGTIDTTKGNIITGDASQTGLRYALIVSPKSLESTLPWSNGEKPAATYTRWDGLTSTASLAGVSGSAAAYCNNLSYPSDGASKWYLPALDELEVFYRNLKPQSANNGAYYNPQGTFPGGPNAYDGVNPSSDPTGAKYTATNPAQTSVAAFKKSGGTQATGEDFYWTSTRFSADPYVWVQSFLSTSNVGNQAYDVTTTVRLFRPVRRLAL